MAKSGARLVEVGTTNRTHLDDYERALSADTGIVVKVHRSNFALAGFVAEASRDASSARSRRSAAFRSCTISAADCSCRSTTIGLRGEPTARDAVRAAGATGIVTMSGDKLVASRLVCR